jgi:hypothetical protein
VEVLFLCCVECKINLFLGVFAVRILVTPGVFLVREELGISTLKIGMGSLGGNS